MTRLIALAGVAGSGKSTAAEYLATKGFVRTRFAGPLKNMMRAIGLSEEEIEGTLKEQPCALLNGHTPRHAMQTLGTEWGRMCLGPDFWVNLWSQYALAALDEGGLVVVEDCRFGNEAEAVRLMGGLIVRITGRGGSSSAHSSEAQAFEADATIDNSGSLDDLRHTIDALLHSRAP